MANQVVVAPLLELVSDKLANLIAKSFGVELGVMEDMKRLSKTLCRIKNVLVDAEKKQVTDLEIQDWLQELKDLAYAAHDVLEKWECRSVLQVPQQTSNNSSLLTDFLNELRERFDDIAKESRELNLQRGVVETTSLLPEQECPGRETGSVLTEHVFGRENDKQKLVSLLLAQYQDKSRHPRGLRLLPDEVTSLKHISICPILGMGGLGKTTLAKLVYNEVQVRNHFEVTSWVCVSSDFDLKRLFQVIIASLTGTACALEDVDLLQRHLQEKLRGKRYLLVLDDVWEDDQDKWNKLKGTLACGAQGSCAIVTTRLETVASITGTVPTHFLEPLSEDDCRSLFKQRAFGSGEKEMPYLMKIGKKIVKKCKGSPLAAKALGASLRFKREPHQWSNVKNSEIWELPENGILPALRLSYYHLPSQLKQCFVYCSIFKKDHKINRKELILLWMANGFVQSKGRMELEDVGNENFEALLWRSFFQDITKDEDGNIVTCKMHDFVHDLACDIAGNESFFVGSRNAKEITRRTLHVSLVRSAYVSASMYSPSMFEFIPKCLSSLRSLMVVNGEISRDESQFIFSHLKYLRALDLMEASIELPEYIGDMEHLRYLNLSSCFHMKSLPESVSKLINLETLNLARCVSLERLPNRMSEMNSLRHLDIQMCSRLTKMPNNMGKLTSLQTLSRFIVGLESGGGIDELKRLNKIRGELKISGLENVKNPRDAEEVNLVKKENLCTLELCWRSNFQLRGSLAEKVMGALQPPPNLRHFFVSGYDGVAFPSWFSGSTLPKVVEIKLVNCNCEHLPPLKRLPLLKVLKMEGMGSLKFIDEDDGEGSAVRVGGFMSLEELEMKSMHNLKGWSSSLSSRRDGGEGDQPKAEAEAEAEAEAAKLLFPFLKTLRLTDCPKLRVVPLPLSIESVRLLNCKISVLAPLQNLPCLSSLEIWDFFLLEHFPHGMLQNCTALKKLVIGECSNIKALPLELESLTSLTNLSVLSCSQLVSLAKEGLRNLSSLTSLAIQNCGWLKRLPELNKSCLVELEIGNCPQLEEEFQHLVVLQKLYLYRLPKLAGFPDGIKQAVMVKELSIRECSEVMDLPDWIGALTSLLYLTIEGCRERKVLPEGLQHLTALKELRILGCGAELERRCKKYIGEDWSKIAHIPKVHITMERH